MTSPHRDVLALTLGDCDPRNHESDIDHLGRSAHAIRAADVPLTTAIAVDADALGLSQDALRTLIAEGEASGPTVTWDMQAVRDELKRRVTARTAD